MLKQTSPYISPYGQRKAAQKMKSSIGENKLPELGMSYMSTANEDITYDDTAEFSQAISTRNLK